MRPLRSIIALVSGRSGFATVAQTGFATGLILFLNVGTGIISARFLGPQGRGELAALLLCPPLLTYLFSFGLSASVVVLIRKNPEQESALMGAALCLSVVAGMLAAVTGVLLISHLISQYSPQVQSEARWLLVLVLPATVQAVLWSGLQLRDRFGTFNRARCWQTAGILTSLTTLVLIHRISPLTGALAYLLPTLPLFAWNLWWFLGELRPDFTQLRTRSRQLLLFGARIHAVDIGNTLFGQLDKFILVALLSPALFGTYVVVFNLSRMITTFGGAVVPVLLPRAAGRPVPEMLESTSRALLATGLLNVVAVLGYLLFGRLILGMLYGAAFSSGYLTLVLLSAEAALTGTASILQQPYLMLGRPGLVALSHLVSLAVGGLLIYSFAAAYGMEGAACGLLSATALRLVLTYLGYRWLLGVAAPRVIPTRNDWQGLLVLGARIRGTT